MTSTPHDSLVRAVFGRPEHAAGLLRSILPKEVAACLDWSRLSLVHGSFVDPELRQRHCDLLFRVPLAGREVFIYLLFEHKSAPERLAPLRLLRYQVRIWDPWLEGRATSSPPLIIPIVLYHGPRAWQYSTQIADVFDVDPDLRAALEEHLPRQRFRLEDLSEYPDDELRERSISALGRLTLLSLKHARHSEDLMARLVASAALFREVFAAPSGLEALERVLRYNLLVSDHVEPAELSALLARSVAQEVGDTVMSVGERLIEQGRLQGREEGIALGEREVLLRLLRARFGEPTEDVCRRIREAPRSSLETWIERILHAATIEDVFQSS